MQRTLESFLRALRAVDVRVSPAEAIDAHQAVRLVGYADRETLKDALCAATAKTADEVVRFETCFETFFRRDEFKPGKAPPPKPDASPSQGGQASESALGQMLMENDAAALSQAMEEAAERAGVADIRLSSQRRLLTRRMLDEMGLKDLEAFIARLQQAGDPQGAALAQRLTERRQALFDEANSYVERQHDLYAGESSQRLREQILADERLTGLDGHEIGTMQTLVRRMAKRLAARYSHQQRRSKRGKLDVRRTLRRSMVHGGVPFDIVWKHETIEKPKIVAICDVSGSVAAAARFLLLFLYSLHEVVERLDAFAFSNRLVAVGDILEDEQVEGAIAAVLARIGMRSTDYGQAWEDFCALHLDQLDRHTTVIILGDARSNYVNPRIDLMRQIHKRARAVIWLNPEPESFWSRGDSEMERYRRFCHVAKTCNTLNELERIIDDVLRTYLPR
ncbi:VWA domain-containing protein [Phenylobacterium montanum]|uniref:VWA domain-containing protein n=1 Tax=Phenylobacterium montanum TaxID=2823693 RepID=A0A975FZZ5_9CAUL|nr:VWA domain-containing protein [Caulobacter sp. S6]QUD87983.1 VWA domain-containing protein [Caulobacter sp. S6]